MICHHCCRRKAARPRGLCFSCYFSPVRDRYPISSNPCAHRGSGLDTDGDALGIPTDAEPGSPEKAAVLEERARLGLSLWHPKDAPMDRESRMMGLDGRGGRRPRLEESRSLLVAAPEEE